MFGMGTGVALSVESPENIGLTINGRDKGGRVVKRTTQTTSIQGIMVKSNDRLVRVS